MAMQLTARDRLRAQAAAVQQQQEQTRQQTAQEPGMTDRLREEEALRQENNRAQAARDRRTPDAGTEQVNRTPMQDRARMTREKSAYQLGDIRNESGRVGKAVQSIGLNTMGSVQFLGDTLKQSRDNAEAYQKSGLQDKANQALEQIRLAKALHGEGSPEHLQAQKDYDDLRRTIMQWNSEPNKAVKQDTLGYRMLEESGRLQEEALEGTEGAGRFLGEAAISIADNLGTVLATGGNPVAAATMMGAKAAAGKAKELTERGVSASEALVRGTVSGAIEAATEKIPLDNMLDVVKSGGQSALKNILKQAGVEGAEEGFSYLFNYLADKAARDPNAVFRPEELLEQIASGAFSGLVFGAGGTAVNRMAAAEAPDVMGLPNKKSQIDTSKPGGELQGESGDKTKSALAGGGPDQSPIPSGGSSADFNANIQQEGTDVKPADMPMLTAEERETGVIRETKNAAGQSQAAKVERENDKRGIVAKLQENIPALQNEPILREVQGTEFDKSQGKLTDTVSLFFKAIGNKVFRKGFGTVLMDKSSVDDDIAHGIGKAKAATFSAVPDVIEKGKQIDYQKNWKGKGKDSYVFAGKVNVEGKTGYLAAVVLQGDDNKFYLHEVVDEKGNFIFINKKDAGTGVQDRTNRESGDTGARVASSAGADALDQNRTSPAGSVSNAGPNFSVTQQGNTVKPVDMPMLTAEERETGIIRQDKPREAAMSSGDRYTVTEKQEKNAGTDAVKVENLTLQNAKNQAGTEDDFIRSLTEDAGAENAEKSGSTREWLKENQDNWDYYADVVEEQARVAAENRTRPEDKVMADRTPGKRTLREKASGAKREFLRKMVDSGDEIARMGKAVGDKNLYPYYNQARAASNTAVNMITGKQSSVDGKPVGKGLNEIFSPIKGKGDEYYNAFQLYLFHMHNQDRMNRYDSGTVEAAQEAFRQYKAETKVLQPYSDQQIAKMATESWSEYQLEAQEYERLLTELRKAENTKNKPVFGYDVTAMDSQMAADTLLREHPEFEELAKEVYTYVDNLMQYRVDSGLITQKDAEQLKKIYPHYVPTYRETDNTWQTRTKQKGVQVGKTVGRATGGTEKLMPIHEALAKQTMSVVREGSKNRFGQKLMEDAVRNRETTKDRVRKVEEYTSEFSVDDFDSESDFLEDNRKTNTFVVRENGKRWQMEVAPELYEGIQVLSPEQKDVNEMVKIVRASNDLFKKLVTSYNPAFTIRNFIRDQQEAWVNSKNLTGYLKNYPKAIREIATGGELWQQYQALGGVYASLFDSSTRLENDQSTLQKATSAGRKIIGKIEAINQAVEQAPRLAEFMATVEKGDGGMDNLMQAMYNAAEVTTNFGRSGSWGKMLNANFVPFLNPGIQGFSKMVRNFTETEGVKPWLRLAGKTAMLGIGAGLLNALMWEDDEEWDELKQRDKDVYYLFKIKDGLWAKIPKGRVLSIYGMTADRIRKLTRGEDAEWGEFIETAVNQVAPANPLENNIASAWAGTKLFDRSAPGRTWYGTDIESQRLQQYAPGERYDERTDKLSKAIGKATNLSPKKINYLLNQYTGVVGDIILPLLTPAAEGNFLMSNFTVDSVTSSRRNGDFYETMEDLEYAKNDPEAGGDANVTYRWWNKVSSAVSKVNQEIRRIENDESLSDKEKLEQTRAQYAIRNGLQAEAANKLEQYGKAAEKWYGQAADMEEEEREDYAYLMANREVFGAEYALQTYGKSTYKKAQEANRRGLGYEDFFDGYFATNKLEPDKDENGKTVEGSAERKKIKALNELGKAEDVTMRMYMEITASDSRKEDVEALREAGMTWKQIAPALDTYLSLKGSDTSATEKATDLAAWADNNLTEDQAATVTENLEYWQMTRAEATTYEKLTDAGLSADKASEVYRLFRSLEPETGKTSVSESQKLQAVAGSNSLTEVEKRNAVAAMLSDTALEKFSECLQAGVSVSSYVGTKVYFGKTSADKDKDGKAVSGSKQKKIMAYINGLPISEEQKDALYLAFYKPKELENAPWKNGIVGLPVLPEAERKSPLELPNVEEPTWKTVLNLP